jgi:thymidylate synthase ThyX
MAVEELVSEEMPTNEEQAMWEIRQYAMAVEELVSEEMPTTFDAFRANRRVAP